MALHHLHLAAPARLGHSRVRRRDAAVVHQIKQVGRAISSGHAAASCATNSWPGVAHSTSSTNVFLPSPFLLQAPLMRCCRLRQLLHEACWHPWMSPPHSRPPGQLLVQQVATRRSLLQPRVPLLSRTQDSHSTRRRCTSSCCSCSTNRPSTCMRWAWRSCKGRPWCRWAPLPAVPSAGCLAIMHADLGARETMQRLHDPPAMPLHDAAENPPSLPRFLQCRWCRLRCMWMQPPARSCTW